MKRIGAVIVFRPGLSKEQAAELLGSIIDGLEVPATSFDLVHVKRYSDERLGMVNIAKEVDRPFKTVDLVHEYDDKHGSGPVWYIP